MSKSINALVNAQDEAAKSENYKLTYKEFDPHVIPVRVKVQNPHERVILEVREVTYLRDGFVREENLTRKIVLESHGTEIVKEILVPVAHALVVKDMSTLVVGQVIRDLRRKDGEQV